MPDSPDYYTAFGPMGDLDFDNIPSLGPSEGTASLCATQSSQIDPNNEPTGKGVCF